MTALLVTTGTVEQNDQGLEKEQPGGTSDFEGPERDSLHLIGTLLLQSPLPRYTSFANVVVQC